MKFVAIVLLGLVASACAQAPASAPATSSAPLVASRTRTADQLAGNPGTEIYEPTRYLAQSPAANGRNTQDWRFLTQPAQRAATNYSGYVFDFNTAVPPPPELTNPLSNITQNQLPTNVFLATLNDRGNGQTLVRFGPCGGNTLHSHPRGSEISTVLYGTLNFGMVEENGGGIRLYQTSITTGMTVHVPQGLLHYSHNVDCQSAGFLANFATADPGTASTIPSIWRVPIPILHMSSGIPEATLLNLRTTYPPNQAPGTGGEDCLRRCNRGTFAANNLVIPVPADLESTLVVPSTTQG